MDKKPKILFFDCETAPVLAWIWHTGKQYVNHTQIKSDQKTGIICICYKWLDESSVHSLDWDLNAQNSDLMISDFGRVLEKADIAIAHNGDAFDVKQINTQRLLHNQGPLSWPTVEDTLKQVRKHFYFPSYSLDYLAKTLTGSGKDRMEFRDWIDIVEGKDPKALKKMIQYCKKDVLKLEAIWKKLAPFAKAKAHAGVIAGLSRESCPRCADSRVHLSGFKTLSVGRYRRYHCQACGHKWRDSRRSN